MRMPSLLMVCGLATLILASQASTQPADSCNNLAGALPFEIALCKTAQRKHALDNIRTITQRISARSKLIPAIGAHIQGQIKRSDSLWKSLLEVDCFLQANVSYPGDPSEAGRLNDQEKGYAIAACQDRFVEERLHFVKDLEMSLASMPIDSNTVAPKALPKPAPPKSVRSRKTK